MSTFTPEKVRELAEIVQKQGFLSSIEKEINKWLEQNHPEPVVVGLSDEQVEQLAYETFQFVEEFFCENNDIPIAGDYGHHLKSWLKHEDFEQPEVNEVVVGLSDIQQRLLGYHLSECEDFSEEWDGMDFEMEISEWQKTQTFVQPGDYEEKYISLYDEYQSLIVDKMLVDKELEQLKSQQFTPNWDDAPEWAEWLAQDENSGWTWYETRPKVAMGYFSTQNICENIVAKNKNWQQTLQERPKPTPQVEVGQVWQTACLNKFEISSIGEYCDEDNVTSPSVTYSDMDNGRIYVRLMSDFLAKFNLVGNSDKLLTT